MRWRFASFRCPRGSIVWVKLSWRVILEWCSSGMLWYLLTAFLRCDGTPIMVPVLLPVYGITTVSGLEKGGSEDK